MKLTVFISPHNTGGMDSWNCNSWVSHPSNTRESREGENGVELQKTIRHTQGDDRSQFVWNSPKLFLLMQSDY